MCFFLALDSSGELGKKLPCEVAGVGRVDGVLAAEIVVEDFAVGGFMDVGEGEVHAVALDRAGHAADKEDGAIGLLPFDDPDVRQRIVHPAVPVVVPGVVEKDEIAWIDDGPSMEAAVLTHMGIDEPDSIGLGIARATVVEIDTVLQEDGAGDAGAVVGDRAAVDLKGAGSDELGGGADDGGSIGVGIVSLATGLSVCGACLVSGTAGEGDRYDQKNQARFRGSSGG